MTMRVSFVLAAFALLVSACGGSPSTVAGAASGQAPADQTPSEPPPAAPDNGDSDAGAPSGDAGSAGQADADDRGAGPVEAESAATVPPDEARAAAEANQPTLFVADDPVDTDVLIVADGTVTTLADAATGDRPLLVWFWAPH